jgi:hypothetical protein
VSEVRVQLAYSARESLLVFGGIPRPPVSEVKVVQSA